MVKLEPREKSKSKEPHNNFSEQCAECKGSPKNIVDYNLRSQEKMKKMLTEIYAVLHHVEWKDAQILKEICYIYEKYGVDLFMHRQ